MQKRPLIYHETKRVHEVQAALRKGNKEIQAKIAVKPYRRRG